MPAISSSIRWLYWARRSFTSVFLRARSAVHWRRNLIPHQAMPGALNGFTRSAVSSTVSDRSSSIGAVGEAQAKEWPGAIRPALPALARVATSFSFSSTVTSWPYLAR